MKKTLQKYLQSDRFILLDRAFLGLYSLFIHIRNNTGKNKILFTSTTCPSPVFAAIMAGCKPIFIDINKKDYLMDYEETVSKIGKHNDIAALVYIYLFGHISEDILKLRQVTREKGIYLIEDVAQAFDSNINGYQAGSIGDAAVFSFGYSKQIDAGNGGCILLNSKDFNVAELSRQLQINERFEPSAVLAKAYQEEFYSIRALGIKDALCFQQYGIFPNKYKELYFKKLNVDWAAVKDKLENFLLGNEKMKRYARAKTYHDAFNQLRIYGKLSLPIITEGCSIYRYTFMTNSTASAQALSTELRDHKINCSNLYIPVSRIYHNENYENAVYFSQRVINLWVDSIATKDYIEKTVEIVKRNLERRETYETS